MTDAMDVQLMLLPFARDHQRALAQCGGPVFSTDDIDQRLFNGLGLGKYAAAEFLTRLSATPVAVIETFLVVAGQGEYYRLRSATHLTLTGDLLRCTAPLWHLLLRPDRCILEHVEFADEFSALMTMAPELSPAQAALTVNLCRRSGLAYQRLVSSGYGAGPESLRGSVKIDAMSRISA